MTLPGLIAPSCVYACTRFRVRRTKLLSREDYRRIMQMSIPGVVAHLGRQEDYRDIISTWQPVFPAPGSSKRQ